MKLTIYLLISTLVVAQFSSNILCFADNLCCIEKYIELDEDEEQVENKESNELKFDYILNNFQINSIHTTYSITKNNNEYLFPTYIVVRALISLPPEQV